VGACDKTDAPTILQSPISALVGERLFTMSISGGFWPGHLLTTFCRKPFAVPHIGHHSKGVKNKMETFYRPRSISTPTLLAFGMISGFSTRMRAASTRRSFRQAAAIFSHSVSTKFTCPAAKTSSTFFTMIS
jgi:hypothetical protein